MGIFVDIYRDMGDFTLDVSIKSNAKRIGILGASGSGKSMTLRMLAGIDKPDRGRIEIDGRVLYSIEDKIDLKPQKRNVGYMFQNYALFPSMTVLQNISAGVKGTKDEKKAKAGEMIARFGLSGLEGRLPGQLSGGQQQRVALARIMASEPDVILLDEPYSALDVYLKDRMQLEMMKMLDDFDGQVIMVSHSRDELYRFSDELYILSEGKVISGGRTEDVFQNPGCLEAARLTGCKNFSAVRKTGDHLLEAADWGITLYLKQDIPDDVKYAGYRAHCFIPVWGEMERNCIPFILERVDSLLFEKNYCIRPQGQNGADYLIYWYCQEYRQKMIEERGLPDYLMFDEEQILLLK